MPLIILALVLVVCFFVLLASITSECASLALSALSVAAGITLWIVIASCQENRIASTSFIKVYTSPDNYQYITENDKPKNVTRLLGTIAPEGYVVKKTKFEGSYGGISGFLVHDSYQFCPAPKVEEEK